MSNRWLTLAAVAIAALVVLAGCGGDEVSLDPPEITYGDDISEMGMFVVDPRFTVAALPQEGDWILFDDIGELLKYHDRFPGTDFRVTWVHDFHSEEWLRAEDAWYVESAGLSTPMGWLVGAFASEDDARAFQAEHGGTVMTWDDANAREWTNPPGPDDPIHGGQATPAASPAASPVASPMPVHNHG